MTVVVLGIDALDPELVDPDEHFNLSLNSYKAIDTIVSSCGEPSTHELWPTIITGLPPMEHGLVLDEGVAWENPIIAAASTVADYLLSDNLQTQLGEWLLTNTNADAFRTPATYYANKGIETVFDDRKAATIGIPNYVVDPESEDREHQLRRSMGDLFERDSRAKGGHRSADPVAFYEQCLEMAMVRIARVRRGLIGGRYELVFGYTSGLDLIGHVSHDRPTLQQLAYKELNQFVGELRADLDGKDKLILVSDHGLQDGLHTEKAMIAATDPQITERVSSVLDIREAVEDELRRHDHRAREQTSKTEVNESQDVKRQLKDLGYI